MTEPIARPPSFFEASPARLARRLLRRPARFVRRAVLPTVMPATSARIADPDEVRVVGLLSSASGLGKSARLCIGSMARAGHRVATRDVAPLFASGDGVPYGAGAEIPSRPGGLSIYHLNPPMLLPGIIKSGLGEYYRSFSIGYWAWELEALPAEWVNALKFVQAVIVPSRFCQAAVQRYTAKPVLVVPHPVDASLFAPQRPEPSEIFRVVNIFRFGSSFERKNPIAAVRAFRAAFGDDRTAELVLKTSYGDRYAADKARLLAEIGSAANIRLIDAVWSEAEMAALVQSASVYLSLHRSEGFGLPIAEAIMAETPVLATAWSGNEDFCSRHDTYLCDYTLVPFRDTHPDYEQVANARWAEPSVAHAAEQLRHMRDNPDPARAQRAKRALQQHLATWDYERALQTILNGTRRPARAANEQADASALSRRVQMGERNARP